MAGKRWRWSESRRIPRSWRAASTSEAYSLLFKLLADPGDSVLVPTPSYPLFDQLSRLESVEARPYCLDPDAGWRIELESVARSDTRCRGVIVVHPNNPTGSHVHPDDAADLAWVPDEEIFAGMRPMSEGVDRLLTVARAMWGG